MSALLAALHDPVLTVALGWPLAVLFGASARHKLRAFHPFTAVMWNYGLLPLAAIRPVAVALIVTEAMLAVAFLVPASVPAAGWAAALLMLLYAFAIGVNLLRGRYDMSCGCDGGGREQPLRPALLVRNAVIALAALIAAGSLPLAGGPAAGAAREMVWLDWFAAAAFAVTIVALWAARARLRELAADGEAAVWSST